MNILRHSVFAGLAALLLAAGLRAEEPQPPARLDPAHSSVRDEGGGIEILLALDHPVPFRVLLLSDPPRLVTDFREVDFGTTRPEALDTSARVTTLRWGRFRPGWSRLVAALDGPYAIDTASMESGAAQVRIRLTPTDKDAFDRLAGARSDADWDLPRPAEVAAPKRRQTGEAPLVVVLDPGHGGIDPGAEAEKATEAGLMLTFARELAEVLRGAGIEAVLTREADAFVPLETRISLARAAGGDLILSLHADALAEGLAVGATVYKLSEEASGEAAALLAERHDRADLLSGIDLSGQDDLVATVLMDLARAETQPRADRLADSLVASFGAAGLKTHRHPIQSGAFSVLKAPDIPSLLLELGFLSSPSDLARLTDPEWRARMQGAILDAIGRWAAADAAEARLLRR